MDADTASSDSKVMLSARIPSRLRQEARLAKAITGTPIDQMIAEGLSLWLAKNLSQRQIEGVRDAG